MKEVKRKMSVSPETILNVKSLIKRAKTQGLVKPHTEAFKTNPVELEKHKGKVNYFCN